MANIIDYDTIFRIIDGVSLIGFIMHDQDNSYPSITPCYKFDGNVVQATLKNVQYGAGSLDLVFYWIFQVK